MSIQLFTEGKLQAFIKAAQYLAALSPQQDIWAEAQKVLVNFFSADFAAFGRRGEGGVEIGPAIVSRAVDIDTADPELIQAVESVLESGFLTFLPLGSIAPMMVACFPIEQDNRAIAVMLVGYFSAEPFAKETLDLFLGVSGIISASHSRRASERAVLQAKEDWERTFDAVPDMIALVDLESRIVRANKALAAKLGITPAECVGHFCFQVMHDSGEPPAHCPYRQVLIDGNEHHVEVWLDQPCGHHVMSASPLRDKNGVLLGGVLVARDISEHKEAEETIRRNDRIMMQQSRQAAMGEMIGNIAHQWRQPLNSLGLILQELPLIAEIGELTAEKVGKTIDDSMRLIVHMSHTIDDFSNFFRPEKEKVPFCVVQQIQRAVGIMEGGLVGIDVSVDTAASLRVYGYPNEYSQVLLNILSNARDAFLEHETVDPIIAIRAREEGGKAVVTIRDNAGGIPEEIIDKIFDPYFTTKGPDKGTGVGLFMSKTIIEKNMKGRLSAQNSGGGAQFLIELTLMDENRGDGVTPGGEGVIFST